MRSSVCMCAAEYLDEGWPFMRGVLATIDIGVEMGRGKGPGGGGAGRPNNLTGGNIPFGPPIIHPHFLQFLCETGKNHKCTKLKG